mgnify:CR=1 FL=1
MHLPLLLQPPLKLPFAVLHPQLRHRPLAAVDADFHADPSKPAKLAVAEPNWYDIMGVDLAAGFEQLEDAPEYKEK